METRRRGEIVCTSPTGFDGTLHQLPIKMNVPSIRVAFESLVMRFFSKRFGNALRQPGSICSV
ncbi:hypothetical protein [Chroococcidiopsis sp. CCMEE 29]|uniref:hypothetical protein n=1 Tax=Chroococcidiopsis sp. CCMEE 29 TaxID=155894 RepID=UPI00201FBC29|nr:hypothetical protein [Chroococcidiopsis sp. CCMEE 29]